MPFVIEALSVFRHLIVTLTVDHHRTCCIGIQTMYKSVQLHRRVLYVSSTPTVPLENLVAMLLKSLPQPALANRVLTIATVLLQNLVTLLWCSQVCHNLCRRFEDMSFI